MAATYQKYHLSWPWTDTQVQNLDDMLGTIFQDLATNVIASTLGGTGFSSYTIGDILYADTTTSLAKLPDVAIGSVMISGGVGVAPSWSANPIVTSLTAGPSSGFSLVGTNTDYGQLQLLSTGAASHVALEMATPTAGGGFQVFVSGGGNTANTDFYSGGSLITRLQTTGSGQKTLNFYSSNQVELTIISGQTTIGHATGDNIPLIIQGATASQVSNITNWKSNGSIVASVTATGGFITGAGTATAGTAPLKLVSGTLLSTTEAGAIEFASSHLYFTAANSGTRFQLDQQLPDPVTVAHGGTGDTTLTSHGVLVGEGTSAVVATAEGATNTVLHGNTGTNPSFSAVVEADITLAANTTNNVSTSKHGFAPILPNDATKFLDGTGAYSTPPGGTVLRKVLTGVTTTIADTYSMIVAQYYAIEGTGNLVIQGDGVLEVI